MKESYETVVLNDREATKMNNIQEECYICRQFEQMLRLCIEKGAFDLLFKVSWCMNTHYYCEHFLKGLGVFIDRRYFTCL